MKPIPYPKIDPEIRELIRAMNDTGFIETKGCCFGHYDHSISEVIFDVNECASWTYLKYDIVALSRRLDYANIDLYQWYRLDQDLCLFNDWVIHVEAHPRTSEYVGDESERVSNLKSKAIGELIVLFRYFEMEFDNQNAF